MTMKLAYGAGLLALGLLALGLLASLAEASAAPMETIIHRFDNVTGDNHCPNSIIAGPSGVLYGALYPCGIDDPGGVFKLTPPAPGHPQWTETYISLDGLGGGAQGGVALGNDGSIYGTSYQGLWCKKNRCQVGYDGGRTG